MYAWRSRLLGPLGLLLALASGSAAAQDARGVDLQLFNPAVDSRGLLTKNRSETLGNKDISFGLWLNGAINPLQLDVNGEAQNVSEALATANFYGSIGLFGFLEAGLNLPFSIVNGPQVDPLGNVNGAGAANPLAAQGLGDIGLHLKASILPQRKFGVGVGALVKFMLPTGGDGGGDGTDEFLSSGVATINPQLIVDTILVRRIKLALNAGANIRSAPGQVIDVTNNAEILSVQNQLVGGLGAGLIVVPDRFDLVAEFNAATDLNGPFANPLTSPLEVIGGAKIFLQRNSFLTLGAGFGLNDAYGSPDVRFFGGITFEPQVGDRDGDGLKDNEDKCPNEPEDFDNFQDEDGCPEPDNDNDGIMDVDDKCPLVPGVMEKQGCPPEAKIGDRDGDGLLDNVDKCPDSPEDFDGFEDKDGCPEPDNDKDGILDGDDECPFEPEDKDNFEDEDGCPEKDNDKDGILDGDDKCPNEPEIDPARPETKNDYQPEDGCPDKKPRVTVGKTNIVITEQIYFDTGKSTIKEESFDILYEVGKVMNDNPQIERIRVEGHTDSDGSDASNLKLSGARSKAVVDFLVSKTKVDRARLYGKGYGEGCPIATNDTKEGKSTNRRSEFVIMEEGEDYDGVCRAQKASAPSTFEKKDE